MVVIGDLVGSRTVADRAGLHRRLDAALQHANRRWGTDLRITVGDEFQGAVPTLGAAVTIALALRLANRVVPRPALIDAACALAMAAAQYPPAMLRGLKAWIDAPGLRP